MVRELPLSLHHLSLILVKSIKSSCIVQYLSSTLNFFVVVNKMFNTVFPRIYYIATSWSSNNIKMNTSTSSDLTSYFLHITCHPVTRTTNKRKQACTQFDKDYNHLVATCSIRCKIELSTLVWDLTVN